MNRIVASVQVRMGSSRYPNKVMCEMAGKPLMGHLISRLQRSKLLDDIVIATSINTENNKSIIECKKRYFRPVEVDYLKGNAQRAKKILKWSPKTSIDNLIDEMIQHEL